MTMMHMQRREFLLASAGLMMAAQGVLAQRTPDVIFVPTEFETLFAMLNLAQVTSKDVLYDLGCGDGRFVVSAALKFGARGVGIDIDPQRISEARELAQRTKSEDKVRFIEADLFEADISDATVVTLYLLTSLNMKLRPKLLKELKPGTRIVSHAFAMGDWAPAKTASVGGTPIYLWRVPARG
jgi:SAM-dependent methyltransferase